jgi:hypothetical protein
LTNPHKTQIYSVLEPLSPVSAKVTIASILEGGAVSFSKHAEEEMRKDGLNDADALNVLRGGVAEPAEKENGTWRYRVRTTRMFFVIAFRSESELCVITAWRIRR